MIEAKGYLPKLPTSWVWSTIGELYNIVGGGTPSTSNPDYWNGEFPWISSADIFGLKDIRPRRFINNRAINESAANLVPKDSLIVVTRVGLGKVALTKTNLCFSQDSQALIGNNSLIVPEYALHYLSKSVQSFRYNHRGTTIAGVTKKQLSELPFPLPPHSEQYRIVAKIEELFSHLDVGIEAIQKAQVQLKRYRQAVLKAAVEGKLTEEWRKAHPEVEPVKELLKPTPIGNNKHTGLKEKVFDLWDLPDSWQWIKLEMCSELITKGESPKWQGFNYVDQGMPFIRSENVLWGNLDVSDTVKIPLEFHRKLKRSVVRPNDVLINLVGASIGRCGVVPASLQEANINQAVALIRSNCGLFPYYLMYLLISPEMQKQIQGTKVETARPNISLGDLNNLTMPLPPVLEQQQIVDEIECILSISNNLDSILGSGLKWIASLRQSILKRAFEGSLVLQNPSDEPANVLIERIKLERSRKESSGRIKGKRGKGKNGQFGLKPLNEFSG